MIKTIILFGSLLCVFSIGAQEHDNLLRKKVTDALTFSLKEACFSATARISDSIVKYSRMHSSGTLLQREEMYDDTGKKLIAVLLENGDGYYQIDDVVGVLKNENPQISRGGYINYAYNAGGMLTNCRNSEYREQKISYQGVPCYKVTLTLNATPEELAKWLQWPLEYVQKEENQIVYAEYVIGQGIPFVYAITRYSRGGGKMPGGIEFTDVRLNPQFSSALFEPSQKEDIKIIKNQKEADKLFAPKNASQTSIFANWWRWIESSFFSNINILSWIFGILGVLCVGIVFGLRIREKYRKN